MKKFLLTTVIALISVCFVQAQNNLDLSKAKMEGVTLEGNTLKGGDTGGKLILPVKSYKKYSGMTMKLSNPQIEKGAICKVIIEYKESDEIQSLSAGFWVKGTKNLKFNAWKLGNETMELNPALIKDIIISIEKDKSVDIEISLDK